VNHGDQRRDQRRYQQQVERRMGLGAVQHHVAHRIAVVDQRIEIR
jgi:hypothetical protein